MSSDSTNQEGQESTEKRAVTQVCFVNEDAKVSPSAVLQYVLDVDQPYDTVISCADGKVGAHRLVLTAASAYIGEMFCKYNHRLGEVAVLVLPDVPVRIMKILLTFCYTGKMIYPKEDELEVLDTMKLLLLGEYADLEINEVTIKAELPPEPVPSTSTSAEQMGQGLQTGTDSVMPPPILNNQLGLEKPPEEVEDDCITTTDEESDDADSNYEKENKGKRSKSSNCKANDSGVATDQTNKASPHHYLIVPQVGGGRSRKLQCSHCVGAFKTIENLSSHLEDHHDIILEPHKLKQKEFEVLSFCNHCKKKHDQISSANSCLSKHNRTRCYVCFQTVRHSQFEQHMKSLHPSLLKNGKYAVKCNWCDAGIVFGDHFDNKTMAGHCFRHHFPGSRGNASIEIERPENSSTSKAKISPSTSTEQKRLPIPKSEPMSVPSKSTATSQLKNSTPITSTTPSTTRQSSGRPVPAVLALLQKASLKRKSVQDSPSDVRVKIENPEKRARVDTNIVKAKMQNQVAKRTGIPVGRLVNLNLMKDGVPDFKCPKTRAKSKSVTIDVGNLPKVYVQFNYGKSFIYDLYNTTTTQETTAKPCKKDLPETTTPGTSFKAGDVRERWFRCSMPLF
ncbi:Protein tramtrack, alpha isoform [Orchesella cincta]|uniref:Protein tramtrack, alpha isoform n=1 Tax=Orchesella cincta TaxID=48709 RepID=A0A1D2NBK7_ORCCI|nr:Protein tramtrack, alpha isoform [Orchesella cincta]